MYIIDTHVDDRHDLIETSIPDSILSFGDIVRIIIETHDSNLAVQQNVLAPNKCAYTKQSVRFVYRVGSAR